MRFSEKAGQALLPALIAGSFVALIAVAIPGILNYVNREQRSVRVKNVMRQVETRLRMIFSNAGNYETNVADGKLKLKNDRVEVIAHPQRPSDKARFSPAILGASCASGGTCRIKVTFDNEGSPTRATISYEGTDLKLKAITVPITAPENGFSSELDCVTQGGIYTGKETRPDGTLSDLCLKPGDECPSGEIFVLDSSLGQCKVIENKTYGCTGSNAFITKIDSWTETLEPKNIECNQERLTPNAGEP